MNKKVVDRYINDLVEMDNDELLFEYRFKMCENEILKRMGENK